MADRGERVYYNNHVQKENVFDKLKRFKKALEDVVNDESGDLDFVIWKARNFLDKECGMLEGWDG